MNKEAIRNGFAGCFSTYSTEAVVQQHIAQTLASMVEPFMEVKPKLAVEVGCGSGFLSELLISKYPQAEWLHNDITPSSREYVEQIVKKYNALNTRFIVGDAERMMFPSGLDLMASSSAVQWFSDLDGFLSRTAQSMSSGGLMAISTFGIENLVEVRLLTGSGLVYFSKKELREMASKYFEILTIKEEQVKIYFDQPVEVLRHIKQTGVNGAFRQCWTKGRLTAFTDGYSKFLEDNGYPLTYHPIYLVARKIE